MRTKYLSIILAGLCLTSCSPRVFLPDRANAPMLREGGEAKLTASIKLQDQSNTTATGWSSSFDLAVSPINHLGLMASFRNTNKYVQDEYWSKHDLSEKMSHYIGQRFELGAGYYSGLGSKGQFEVYGGFGWGDLHRKMAANKTGNFNTDYYRIFLQPALGFNHRDKIELSGGLRFSYQQFTSFNSDRPTMTESFTVPAVPIDQTDFYFIEPFLNFSVGAKYIKFNIQPGFAHNISSPKLDNELSFYLSMGLTFQFAPRF